MGREGRAPFRQHTCTTAARLLAWACQTIQRQTRSGCDALPAHRGTTQPSTPSWTCATAQRRKTPLRLGTRCGCGCCGGAWLWLCLAVVLGSRPHGRWSSAWPARTGPAQANTGPQSDLNHPKPPHSLTPWLTLTPLTGAGHQAAVRRNTLAACCVQD